MSAQVESIDDLFLNLTAMGFESEDCQEAVQAGFLSVPEAVEWILNGKPGNGQHRTLQLRKTTNSIFDGTGLAVGEPSMSTSSQNAHPTVIPQQQSDIKVPSKRTNEVQRKQWDKFHEKQRVEAELSAKFEKSEKQRAHLKVLQQIALDRQEKTTAANNSKENIYLCANTRTDPEIEKPPSKSTITTIQVRCPDGAIVKKIFNCNDKLHELWDILKEKFPNTQGMALLQPFPRHEFSTEDFAKSYAELNLVPSGSLVLNLTTLLKDTPASGPQRPPLVPPHRERSPPEPALVQVPDDRRVDFDGGIRRDELLGRRQRRDNPPPLQEPPLQNLMAEVHQVLENAGLGHVWGSGQKLQGDHLRHDDAAHHNVNPMDLAREAALQRADQRDENEAVLDTRSDHSLSLTPPVTVPSLVNQCMTIMVKRLNNPVTCSAVALNLPADVAERILQHMKKELVLSPRTLQPFLSCHLNCIVLDFYPYATNELLHTLRLHTTIQHLSLASCSLINDAGLVNLKYLKRLVSLNLRECIQVTDSSFQFFSELPQLTSLNLEGTKISDAGVQSYIHSRPIALQHLNLSRTSVTDQALESISVLINLRGLVLDETQVKCLRHLCSLGQLEALSLRATPISPDALVCLEQLPKLNALNISQLTFVEGDQALELIKNLKLNCLQLPSRLTTSDNGLKCIKGMRLSSLDLTNYINVTDAGIKCLGDMTSLKVLLLSNTKTTDEGLLSLKKLSNLEVLYLDRTLITDFGTSVFKGMPKLTELSLASTSIGKKCLINGNLNYCFLLHKLNLNNTQVTDKGLRNLSLPNLTIISLDGTRLRSDPKLSLTGCPQVRHISAKNVEPRGMFDSDDQD